MMDVLARKTLVRLKI